MATRAATAMPKYSAALPALRHGADAADRLATLAGGSVAALALAQLFVPIALAPITGLGTGDSAAIVAAIWCGFGAMLFFGGAARLKPVAIHAALALLVVGSCGAAILLWNSAGVIPLALHGAIAAGGIVCGAISRIAERAEMRRELRSARMQSAAAGTAEVTKDTQATN